MYKKQPPPTAQELNCNPFVLGAPVEERVLVLLCEVDGPLDSNFQIAWFKNLQPVCSDNMAEVVDCNQTANGTKVCSQLSQIGDQVQEGNTYFCQVVVNGSLMHTVQSETMHTLNSSDYFNLGVGCLVDNARYIAREQCADAESFVVTTLSLCSMLPSTPSPSPEDSTAPPTLTTATEAMSSSPQVSTTSFSGDSFTASPTVTTASGQAGVSTTPFIIAAVVPSAVLLLTLSVLLVAVVRRRYFCVHRYEILIL